MFWKYYCNVTWFTQSVQTDNTTANLQTDREIALLNILSSESKELSKWDYYTAKILLLPQIALESSPMMEFWKSNLELECAS